jgi:pimeloyl-ACP methyl ester carboxylesterase
MPHVHADALTMYYESHGRAAGPDVQTLVLLHGFNNTGARAWRHQLTPLGERYRLLVPDWRGHGRTDNPGGAAAMNHRQFARDAAAFCRALGVQRALFCGSSSGAMQLLSLALDEPDLVQAMVLCAGSHYYPDALRAWWATLTVDEWVPADPPERRATLREMHTALGPDHWRTVVGAWIALGRHAHTDDFPEPEQLRAIRAPTLIVHGDRDRFFPAEMPVELYRLLPDAELAILPNTGHGVPGEHPEWLTTLTLDFFSRRTPLA